MLFWRPCAQCTAFTPPSSRCWSTSSSVLPGTSPSVSERVCEKAPVIQKHRTELKLHPSCVLGCDCVSTCSGFVCSGTFAVLSIMIGGVTERLAPDGDFITNGTNGTGDVNIDARDEYRVQIACSLTILAGIFQVCVSTVTTLKTTSDRTEIPFQVMFHSFWLTRRLFFQGAVGCGEVWFRGQLPLWATGPRLHHRISMSRVRLPAPLPVWSLAGSLHRSSIPYLCERVIMHYTIFWPILTN